MMSEADLVGALVAPKVVFLSCRGSGAPDIAQMGGRGSRWGRRSEWG